MLGRFLELSLATPDIQASLDFYLKLGFSETVVGETWPHPYAVVTDGRICLGLHALEGPAAVLTFVKPGLLGHLRALEAAGIDVEYRRLGNDVFNEIGWRDPAGHPVRMIEARTFSPAKRRANAPSNCGYFLEIVLAAADLPTAKTHWERVGFVGIETEDCGLPHIACTSDSVDIGLYPPVVAHAGLRFEVDDLTGAVARLTQAGATAEPWRGPAGVMIRAPEGTPLLVTTPPA